MRFPRLMPIFGTVVILWAAQVLAADPPEKCDTPAKASHPGFEKLKQLAGDWIALEEPAHAPAEPAAPEDKPASVGKPEKKDEGKKAAPADKPGPGDKPDTGTKPGAAAAVVVNYRVVSGGHAVLETLLPGTPHEMVTLYYLDGPDLVLTHYCMLGNQPHMKAAPTTDANQLAFKFAGGSNIDPAKDAHMHELVMTFIDADHIRSEWTSFKDGQKDEVAKFKLQRKK